MSCHPPTGTRGGGRGEKRGKETFLKRRDLAIVSDWQVLSLGGGTATLVP